ncbi:hypothetical protein FOZ60_015745 [Perkinsus olseni]|uniref:Nodulin-like domain-containing protein n=1 Tax=Perkinsus olseni TaxID=32597 RepID=A0A7J6P5E2_PEROL|nr:hypothetical protein FOZ60_015745 [Perkinsus olseni]
MSFILVLLAGVGYCFPLYSDALMTALGMSRSQLTLVPALLNVGGGLVAPAGLCITKLGLRTAILAAGGLITVGYVGMYTISTSESVQSLLGDLGLVTGSLLTANTTNYPSAKGQVTGITKCIFGLAAPTVTLLFVTLHGAEGSPLTFLLLVNVLGLTLALLQLVDFFLGVPKWLSLLMVVSLFALMIALPVRAERHLSPTEYTSISPAPRTSNSYYYIGTAPLKSALFWAAFVGLSAAFGGGLAFINNQAQLIPSDIPDRSRVVGALLTVVTATSAASRVLTGWVADRSRLLPRPGYVIILIITMAAAFTLLSRSTTVRNLFICGPMIGVLFRRYVGPHSTLMRRPLRGPSSALGVLIYERNTSSWCPSDILRYDECFLHSRRTLFPFVLGHHGDTSSGGSAAMAVDIPQDAYLVIAQYLHHYY